MGHAKVLRGFAGVHPWRIYLEAGLVEGDNLSVDGSFVEANASKGSRIPREQLAEAAQVNRGEALLSWTSCRFSSRSNRSLRLRSTGGEAAP